MEKAKFAMCVRDGKYQPYNQKMIADKDVIKAKVGDIRGLIILAWVFGFCINTVTDPFIPEGEMSYAYYLVILATVLMFWYLVTLYRDVLNEERNFDLVESD